MIRPCSVADVEAIYHTINDAAEAYRGVIPEDCWHEPYMTKAELQQLELRIERLEQLLQY